MASKDSRIDISCGENSGPAAARNALIARARGEYLAIMDADDICRPERFARQVAHLDAHPEIAVLGTHILYIDEDGRPVHNITHATGHDEIDARNMEGRTDIAHPSVMMRHAAVREIGGYDESFKNAQDTDLWLRMAERFRLANFPEVLLDYRFHPFSVSSKKGGDRTGNHRARQAAAARRGLPEDTVQIRPPWSWRPAPDRRSQSDFAVNWAWRAGKEGYPDTARHYFLKAVRLDPLSRRAWHGFVFGVLRKKKVDR